MSNLIRDRINHNRSLIEQCETEIRNLQSLCQHKTTSLTVSFQWAGHLPSPVKVCHVCDKMIYDLTTDEVEWVHKNCFPYKKQEVLPLVGNISGLRILGESLL